MHRGHREPEHTSYSAQIEEAYQLADRFRAAGTPVVMGGTHVTAESEEAGRHADSVAVGEAEVLWPRIVEDAAAGRLEPVYREENPGTYDLAAAPTPRYDLLAPGAYNRITVQTSRGCPHTCEFCAGTKLFGRGFRQKPVGLVVNEIERIRKRWRRPFIEFADDNTFVDKEWSKELLKALVPLGTRWFAETDVSVAEEEELLRLMYQSGCYQLLIGLESTSKDSLDGIEAHNWKLEQRDRYLESIQRIQANGIAVNGCFIVGLDGDTEGIFAELRDFIAAEAGLDRDDLTPDANLYDLGIDSLSALEILTTLEQRYGITIPENELAGVHRIADVVERVSRCIDRRGGRAAPG